MIDGLLKEGMIKTISNMKKLGLILFMSAITTIAFTQGKYGATPQDSVTCIENLIYKEYMKSDAKLALKMWRKAYAICPGSQKSLYINGVKMYKNLHKKSKDKTVQKTYFDTIMSIYDQRIQYFGQKGFVLGRKGTDAFVLDQSNPEFALNILNESMSLMGDKTEPGTLVSAMYATINLEKKGVKTKEEVVEMFTKTTAICAANSQGKKAEKYAKAQANIEGITAPYLDCETIIAIAEAGFETNQENIDWLTRAAKLMKAKDCTKSDIFVKIATKAVELSPSAEGYANLGVVLYDQGDYSKAIEKFKDAAESAEVEDEKADYYYYIASAYFKMGQYSSVKSYALKAASSRSGWGKPYMMIGDAYASSSKACDDGELGKWAVYWVAVDMYQKAKGVDASVASDASRKIAAMSARYPSTQDIFFYGKQNGDSYTVKCWINETTTIRIK